MDKSIETQIAKRYPECTLEHYAIEDEHINIYLHSDVEQGICPVCGNPTHSADKVYVKKFADLPIDDMFTTVHLTMRNLTCRAACARKTFFPALHSFLPDPYAKKTERLVKRILKVASKYPVRKAVIALEKEHIKCDKNTISRLLKANGLRKCDLAD